MAVRQVACSVQNDGNFCQLDLRDEDFGGPLQRIETYRCSHPSGGDYGATVAGTPVAALLGPLFDHHNMSSIAAAGESLFKMSAPLTIDPKPGVYAIFWLAYL